MLSRRTLIKSSSLLPILAAIAGSPARLAMAAGGGGTLVLIFLRGGMDGLNLLAPLNDCRPGGTLFSARSQTPSLVLGQGATANAITLTSPDAPTPWLLHPNAQGLSSLYHSGRLSFLPAAGNPASTRSHFQMQALCELGFGEVTDQPGDTTQGWFTKYYLTSLGGGASDASADFSLFSTADTLPLSMVGAAKAVCTTDLTQFNLGPDADARTQFITASYGALPQKGAARALSLAGQATVNSMSAVQSALGAGNINLPADSAGLYGQDALSQSLLVVAQAIKLNLGLRGVAVDFGDWDTHVDQARDFPGDVAQLSAGLSSFLTDMDAAGKNVSVVVMSEFGRRIASNGSGDSGGTDHGHGGLMLVAGTKASGLKGGRILGTNPNLLDPNYLQASQDGDVPLINDYRTALRTVIAGQGGDPSRLFSATNYDPSKLLAGVF